MNILEEFKNLIGESSDKNLVLSVELLQEASDHLDDGYKMLKASYAKFKTVKAMDARYKSEADKAFKKAISSGVIAADESDRALQIIKEVSGV